MNQIIIVTGGEKNKETYQQFCSKGDFTIGVDSGAVWLIEEDLPIDLAVGDFDTAGVNGLNQLVQKKIPVQRFVAEKDMTDTEIALMHALDLGAKEIVLLGGVGTRFDHSLANVQLLYRCLQRGVRASIVDPRNRIQWVRDSLKIYPLFPYVSLLPLTPVAGGITLKGFKYPLEDATLTWGDTRGVSNELKSKEGTITIEQGYLLVIESRDTL